MGRIGDVELPLWANDAAHFLLLHRQALESDYVRGYLGGGAEARLR